MLTLTSASCNSTGLCFDPQIRNTFPCQLGQLGEVTFKHESKERKFRGALRLGKVWGLGQVGRIEQPFLFTKPCILHLALVHSFILFCKEEAVKAVAFFLLGKHIRFLKEPLPKAPDLALRSSEPHLLHLLCNKWPQTLGLK